MKELEEVLTPKQLEQYKDVYLIGNSVMQPICSGNTPTADTFKAVAINADGKVAVYTAEDFSIDSYGDFVYDWGQCGYNYIYRDDTPVEVIEILDAVIRSKKEASKE